MWGSIWVVPVLVSWLLEKSCGGCYFVYAAYLVGCWWGKKGREGRTGGWRGGERDSLNTLLPLLRGSPAHIRSKIHLLIRQAGGWLEEYKCLLSFSMAEALFPASSPSGPVTSDMVITHIMYPGTWWARIPLNLTVLLRNTISPDLEEKVYSWICWCESIIGTTYTKYPSR